MPDSSVAWVEAEAFCEGLDGAQGLAQIESGKTKIEMGGCVIIVKSDGLLWYELASTYYEKSGAKKRFGAPAEFVLTHQNRGVPFGDHL